MSLHPHQMVALEFELSLAEYGGMTADQAYERLSGPNTLAKRLGRLRFITEAKLAALPQKRRPAEYVVIGDDVVTAFPTGVPGFPNKLRRESFDAAWAKVRG